MPEYLAPGVYVEEVSFRSKSIEGVSTTTTGFVGPTRYGPIDLVPDVLTSLGDFELTYGDRKQLLFGNDTASPTHNYMWHAVRAFFQEGGKRLYVSRIFRPRAENDDGRATKTITRSTPHTITVKSRTPGDAGKVTTRFTLNIATTSILGGTADAPTVTGLSDNDLVWIPDIDTADPTKRLSSGVLYIAKLDSADGIWKFHNPAHPAIWLKAPATLPTTAPRVIDISKDSIRIATITVAVLKSDGTPALEQTGLKPDPNRADSLFNTLGVVPGTTTQGLPLVVRDGGKTSSLQDGLLVVETLFSLANGAVADPNSGPSKDVPLQLGNSGSASATLTGPTPTTTTPSSLTVKARFPGAAGNMIVRFTLNVGQNILGKRIDNTGTSPTVSSLSDNDIVWISDLDPANPDPANPKKRLASGTLYIAKFDPRADENTWKFYQSGSAAPASPAIWLKRTATTPSTGNPRIIEINPENKADITPDNIRIVTLTVTVIQNDGSTPTWSGLSTDPRHTRNDQADSLFDFFSATPANSEQARSLPIIITRDNGGQTSGLQDGILVLEALFSLSNGAVATPDSLTTIDVLLEKGNDGAQPTSNEYEGTANPSDTFKTGLRALEDIEDISIVAAPGSTANYAKAQDTAQADANTIISLLIGHAEYMRYRIAVLDSGEGQSISQVRAMRAKFDSKHAALYYPWVRILDPVTRVEINLPPSGFVSGIYARNDTLRAVYKAPANEVVNLALGFEKMLNKAQQEVLNPEGINCFRFFEGRGYRLWGARTISSDSEWKYVNLRRYFAYLEHSIDKGTQFAVFEPNGPLLWANVRRTIEDFLLNEWQNGALLGDKPETSYFVRCDRSTMTQNDLDNGRLIVLIGVAPLRPAEFVIFRIGQWTGDRRG